MKTNANSATFLASLGAGFEYYDFIVYGLMASYLGPLFFGADEPFIALLKIFGAFAVGYLTRPIGGVLFGMIGDAYGRKNTFIAVMLLMALSTLAIGFLPTYADIGAFSCVLLILLRMLQGISFGAELPGAITVVCEYAEGSERGIRSGVVVSSVSIGSLLASFVLLILTSTLSHESIMAWGWRIPFLFGGSLGIVNYFIRLYLDETPEYLIARQGKPAMAIGEPLFILVKLYLKQLFIGIGMTLLQASMIIFILYLPTFLTTYYHYKSSDIYFAMTWGLVWVVCILPFCGYIADRLNKSGLFLATSLTLTALMYPLFMLINNETLASLIFFTLIFQTGIAFLSVCYFPIIASLFPTVSRFTGIAASYNIGYCLMATTPLILTALIHYTGNVEMVCWFLISCGLITSVSIKLNK